MLATSYLNLISEVPADCWIKYLTWDQQGIHEKLTSLPIPGPPSCPLAELRQVRMLFCHAHALPLVGAPPRPSGGSGVTPEASLKSPKPDQ